MAYTVAAAFEAFFDAINLSGDRREIANTRKDHLVSLLKKDFTIQESFASGSIPRFTALKAAADLDIIVALHYSSHVKDKAPIQVLQAVRNSLAEYKTDVRKNGQAVTLYYDSWPNVDIVPACQSTNNAGEVTHYNIPDMRHNRWLQSRPKSHSRAIEGRSTVCGPSFRQIIKMLKHWNSIHSNYLESFHIEVMALNILTSSLNDIPWDVYSFFKSAVDLAKTPLFYDGSYADAYLSDADRAEVVKRLVAAREMALQAWHATYEEPRDHEGAIRRWRIVFGDKFPQYG